MAQFHRHELSFPLIAFVQAFFGQPQKERLAYKLIDSHNLNDFAHKLSIVPNYVGVGQSQSASNFLIGNFGHTLFHFTVI